MLLETVQSNYAIWFEIKSDFHSLAHSSLEIICYCLYYTVIDIFELSWLHSDGMGGRNDTMALITGTCSSVEILLHLHNTKKHGRCFGRQLSPYLVQSYFSQFDSLVWCADKTATRYCCEKKLKCTSLTIRCFIVILDTVFAIVFFFFFFLCVGWYHNHPCIAIYTMETVWCIICVFSHMSLVHCLDSLAKCTATKYKDGFIYVTKIWSFCVW